VTARDKALRLLAEGKVRHIPGTRYHFAVLGDSADPLDPKPYTVTIQPDSCDCIAHGTCSHVIAARLALNVFRRERT
jgi:hypothetical protein